MNKTERIFKLYIIVMLSFSVTNCVYPEGYFEDLERSKKALDIPGQLEQLFGSENVDHSISNYLAGASGSHKFHSVSYFYGRYKINYGAWVDIQQDGVKVEDSGQVVINELIEIIDRGDGIIETNYGDQFTFDSTLWNEKFAQAKKEAEKDDRNLEISDIVSDLKEDEPLPQFPAYVEAWRK